MLIDYIYWCNDCPEHGSRKLRELAMKAAKYHAKHTGHKLSLFKQVRNKVKIIVKNREWENIL